MTVAHNFFLTVVAVIFCLEVAVIDSRAETLTARTSTEKVVHGLLAGNSVAELSFKSRAGRTIPLSQITQLTGGDRNLPPSGFPLCRVKLRSGDDVLGELVRLDDKQVSLRLPGGTVCQILRSRIRMFGPPRGYRLLFLESFKHPTDLAALKLQGNVTRNTTGSLQFPRGTGAELTLPQFKDDSGSTSGSLLQLALTPRPQARWQLEFRLGSDDTLRMEQSAGGPIVISASFPVAKQAIPDKPGQRQIAMWHREKSLRVFVDGAVVASAESPRSPVTSLRVNVPQEDVKSSPSRTDTPAANASVLLWQNISFASLGESSQHETRHATTAGFGSSDAVLTHRHGLLFGSVTSADGRGVELKNSLGRRLVPWQDVIQVHMELTAPKAETAPAEISGWVSELQLTGMTGPSNVDGGRLFVAVESADDDGLTVQHFALGTFRVPWHHVSRLQPRYAGKAVLLTDWPRHLGNDTRVDFAEAVPSGSTLSGEFSLADQKPPRASVRLRVRDIEPSGERTPLASPHLRALRLGHLLTRLHVNGRPVCTLNTLLHSRANSSESVWLDVPLANGILKSGRNTWSIQQTSAMKNADEYDDCEVGPIMLQLFND